MDTGFKSGLQTNENYWKNKDSISKSATSLQNKQTSKLLSTCTPELDFQLIYGYLGQNIQEWTK